jgi:asparagine synthetase B (glutamine-hydrolysing)
MCGITGIVQIGGHPRRVVDEEILAAVTDAMTHRGPDDRGTFVEPGIALGMRRLSVVDPELGSQPIVGGRNGRSRTASSTTIASFTTNFAGAGTPSRPTATRRSCRTSTRRTATT